MFVRLSAQTTSPLRKPTSRRCSRCSRRSSCLRTRTRSCGGLTRRSTTASCAQTWNGGARSGRRSLLKRRTLEFCYSPPPASPRLVSSRLWHLYFFSHLLAISLHGSLLRHHHHCTSSFLCTLGFVIYFFRFICSHSPYSCHHTYSFRLSFSFSPSNSLTNFFFLPLLWHRITSHDIRTHCTPYPYYLIYLLPSLSSFSSLHRSPAGRPLILLRCETYHIRIRIPYTKHIHPPPMASLAFLVFCTPLTFLALSIFFLSLLFLLSPSLSPFRFVFFFSSFFPSLLRYGIACVPKEQLVENPQYGYGEPRALRALEVRQNRRSNGTSLFYFILSYERTSH